MAGAPKYKLYHGSTYIGSFKYSDDAETYCEAMQKAGKIVGELTIRDGHTKSSIELRYPQLVADVTAKVLTKELDPPIKYINVEVADGFVVSANLEGVEYGLSINDTGDEPSELFEWDGERSCIAITSSHGRFIVEAITGRVRSFMPVEAGPHHYEWITRFDLTEYREWRGMKPNQNPIGGEIDMLLVGYWYVEIDEKGKPILFEHPCGESRQVLLEQLGGIIEPESIDTGTEKP